MSDVAWMFAMCEIRSHAYYMSDPDEKVPKEIRITLARNECGWGLGPEYFYKRTRLCENSSPQKMQGSWRILPD